MRACIGRPFAWQEVQIAMVTIMQRFDLIMDDPSYELELRQTLTIKPRNFYIHAIPRKNKPRLLAIPSSAALSPAGSAAAHGGARTSYGMRRASDATPPTSSLSDLSFHEYGSLTSFTRRGHLFYLVDLQAN